MKPARWTASLSLKLIVCLVGSMIIVFSWLGYRNVEIYRNHLEDTTFENADGISNLIKNSTRYGMLQNRRDELHETIKTIGREPGINKIRVFDEIGRIKFSTDQGEIDTPVDKSAEACYKCHAEEAPLTRLDRPDRMRIYRLPTGERILGLINPVENEPSCSNADCHAHPSDKKVLGVLDVTLSLAAVDGTISQGRKSLLVNLTGAVMIVSGVCGVLIWTLVHKPVHRLFLGTQSVAKGDLDYKIEVSSRDEIAHLAASFNLMTGELKKARGQLLDWARTLENSVQEKTREIQQAHENMIHVERMASMGRLAAIVAHEINNPLAGILTSARFLLKKHSQGCASETATLELKEYLELIASESSRCGEIVKNLLQFTRQTKGQYVPCEVRDLLAESLRLVKHKLDLMDVDVRMEVDPALPPVLCDPPEIKQAIVALILNACDALGRGPGSLELGARRPTGAATVEIRVKDNGVGMDAETQKHVFEPFFTTKEDGSGVGLGLPVVMGIVTRHGGTIRFESAPGRGTTVFVELPASTRGEASSSKQVET